MKTLLEINDAVVGLPIKENVEYHPRTAVRAVLRDGNKIALLHVRKHHYYKLPGGGVDDGETPEEGLKREIREEVGCTFTILQEIGEIRERRSHVGLAQTSYCYLAKIQEGGKPTFTEEEAERGFTLRWVTFVEALQSIKNSQPSTYDGKFIVVRDLRFLQAARKFF